MWKFCHITRWGYLNGKNLGFLMHWKMWSRRPKSRWNMHGKSLFPVINPDCMNRRDICKKAAVKFHQTKRMGHMHKKIAVKSHQTKRVGHMCKKIAEISRQKKKEGHRSKEKLYMSQQYRWSGHKDKEKQYMSQQHQ